MAGAIILQIILILGIAIFASAEIAVISINDSKLKNMVQEGDHRAGRLEALTRDPAKFLATIQVALTLFALLGSAFAADFFADPLSSALLGLGIPLSGKVTHIFSVVIITLVLTYLSLVFGELIPKRIAMKKSEKTAFGMSGFLSLASKVFSPLVWLFTASANFFLKIFGINPDEENTVVTEEEIRMMLAEGKEQGTIQNEESKMIQNVFEFDDTTVEQVSTRRRDVVCLHLEDDARVWEETIRGCRYSHFPIIDSNQEDVVGILDTKDYFRSENKSKEFLMEHAVDQPCFVPENMRANALFSSMKKSRTYFAVILDEYGGMSGIVTLHDLVEALVGELEEEEVPPKPADIKKLRNGVWRIQGCAQLDEVSEELGIAFPEIFDTFNGFVWDTLGRVPADGEHFSLDAMGMNIDVKNIKNHMVDYAIVSYTRKED
ncbi:MAG: hemolysin family protein [Anaerobutyricum sp.]|nr:hemolysin family protein [Anaerobutyricum sp.]